MARLETGVVQDEGDWPGIFIRGDDVINHMLVCKIAANILRGQVDNPSMSEMTAFHLDKLVELLNKSNVNDESFDPAAVQTVKKVV